MFWGGNLFNGSQHLEIYLALFLVYYDTFLLIILFVGNLSYLNIESKYNFEILAFVTILSKQLKWKFNIIKKSSIIGMDGKTNF